MHEGEGLQIRLLLQVDTLCHRIPHFIEKAARAGVDFSDLELRVRDLLVAMVKALGVELEQDAEFPDYHMHLPEVTATRGRELFPHNPDGTRGDGESFIAAKPRDVRVPDSCLLANPDAPEGLRRTSSHFGDQF